jgi:hypothetical protein
VVASWADCRAALAERVRGLGLADTTGPLPPERVYEHAVSVPQNISYPCVELTISGLQERWKWWTTDHIKWEYPIGLIILFRGAAQDPAKEAPYLLWRDQIAASLPPWKPPGGHRVRVDLSGNITGSFRARGEPGQTRDPLGPAGLKVAGSMVVWFEVIKARSEG